MIPFEEEFEQLQARVMFGMNKLEIPWLLGTEMVSPHCGHCVRIHQSVTGARVQPADLPAQIMSAIEPAGGDAEKPKASSDGGQTGIHSA